MSSIIIKSIEESIKVKSKLLNESVYSNILEISNVVTTSFKSGNKVLFCGNGGSAADAQHLAAEFSGRFYKDRKALPSEALHCNTSYLTAVANDYSFEDVYSRIIDGVGVRGDILIGISTSGNSKNIVKAFKRANEIGVITIGLTGKGGGAMKEHSKFIIEIDSNDTPRIQESHILVGHIICEIVENNLF
jgi:D-sedoheptulose 7-phosphate isomerase